MSIKSKVKAFLQIKNVTITAYANKNNTSLSNQQQKIIKDKIYFKDLIDLCAFAGCHISIIDNKSGHEIITFNEYDINPAMDPADKETKE